MEFLFEVCVGIIAGYLLYKMSPSIEKDNGRIIIFYTNLKTNSRDYIIIGRNE